ncbi:MAG: class I SAM-dependent methyltransferase, partial [Candidatus Rokuibacteriota bacterium]
MTSPFVERQTRFFTEADTGHFFWQTRNPYFARTERALLEGFPVATGDAVLEVGCGEGGNLVNVLAGRGVQPRLVVGADLFARKLVFAGKQSPGARFVCADAGALPFRDGAFDVVLCRDLLHHLEDREPAVAELRRVARPRGHVWVVEPNGRNALIRLLAVVRPHERGQLRNSPDSLRALLGRHFPGVEVELRQPMPLSRLVLHYQFGFPRLGA